MDLQAQERQACAEHCPKSLSSGFWCCQNIQFLYHFRMGEFFKSGQLVEINSHSLFSKWFSESGKLVQKMFTEIKRLMEDQE